MPVITANVGLPASGRMYYAQQEQKNEGGLIVELGHDASRVEKRILIESMMDGRDIFYIDATLCDDRTKASFVNFVTSVPEYELKWVYFANDRLVCLSNAEIPSPRHYSKIRQHIRAIAKTYKIPIGVKQIPVFDRKNPIVGTA